MDNQDLEAKLTSPVRKYLVDTSANMLVYSPMMAVQEHYLAGMDWDEVGKSRLMALGAQLFAGRAYGIFRNYWVKKVWKSNAEESGMKKYMVDTTGMLVFQTPLYAGILGVSGASLDEFGAALLAGTTIAVTTARPFGYVLDCWRKYWKTNEAFE
jgi:hypothetical protein